MRIISIVGARPQFIKIAPVSRAIQDYNSNHGNSIEDVIVHTGQHYDANMSDVFFTELDIPTPSFNLEIGSASHGAQTGRMLEALEELFVEQQPDLVVVYGDTNSTLAGSLAATKMLLPVAHIEAGLRSFNRAMPEEINRIVSDHTSDLLLAPTRTALEHLANEGLSEKAKFVGDVMLDAVLYNREIAASQSDILNTLGVSVAEYGLVTIHRAENTSASRLKDVLGILNDIASRHLPLVFPMHPRTRAVIAKEMPNWAPAENLKIIDPLGYLDILNALANASVLFTDSGGMQKEALFVDTPCVTLRSETEWVETVEVGANIITDVDHGAVLAAAEHWLSQTSKPAFAGGGGAFGGGNAARSIVDELVGLIV